MSEPTLAQRLGYDARGQAPHHQRRRPRVLYSANVGVFDCLATGVVTSAALMVPVPVG